MSRSQRITSVSAVSAGFARKIPSVKLHPERMPPEERFDAWFDSTSRLSDISIHNLHDRQRGVMAASWLLGPLIFLDARICAHTTRRRKSHLRRSSRKWLTLIKGGISPPRIIIGGNCIEQDLNAFHLTDYSREQTEICGEENYSCVYLPHDMLGYDPSIHPAHMRIGLDTVAGEILNSASQAVHQQLDCVSPAEVNDVAAGFCGLVRGLFLQSADANSTHEPIGKMRKQAMMQYLDTQLGNPYVGVRDLCARFGLSRATVYRDFAEEGGFNQYLYLRRLQQAYHDLETGPVYRGRVTQVAIACGFESVSHFSRRFRTRYGFQPSELLGSAAMGQAPMSGNSARLNAHSFSAMSSWIQQGFL